MTVPDVTAYRLEQAVDKLEKAGVRYYLRKIAPPIDIKKNTVQKQPFKVYRVLKQDEVGSNLLVLTVAEEQEGMFSV